jgi:imidazolonepropionase-like amidohydrolase
MNDKDALQNVSAALQQLQAQNEKLVERLLTSQQEIARHRRSIDLLRALPLNVHQRIGTSLVQDLVQAEGLRAADQAVREFPEFLREVERRAQQRQSP